MSGAETAPGSRFLDPRYTAAVVFGAHDWTEAGMSRAPSFLRSAKGVVAYLIDSAGLGLDPTLVLDLFDDTASAGDQLARIRDTLDTLLRERRQEARPVADLLIYYVGHGHTDDQGHLSLLVRRSRRGMEAETGIKAPDLARVLKVAAPQQRRVVILDCCFSEAAARDFIGQSGALDQAVAATAVKDLRDDQPQRGTLLFCSSPVGEVSMGAPRAERTLFTGAVLEVLGHGVEGASSALSFADLRDAAYERMVVNFGANAPRPVLHQVNAAHGDLTRTPAFPNRAERRRHEEEAKRIAEEERRRNTAAEAERQRREREREAEKRRKKEEDERRQTEEERRHREAEAKRRAEQERASTAAKRSDTMSGSENRPVRVFISYRHANRRVLDELRDHLGWLESSEDITVFDDRQITAGDDWDVIIRQELDRADIIMLVISAAFMRSHYCTRIELREALGLRSSRGVRVIPIIAETCDWEAMPFQMIAALPKDRDNNLKPLNKWGRDRDVALTQVAQQVRQNVERVRAGRRPDHIAQARSALDAAVALPPPRPTPPPVPSQLTAAQTPAAPFQRADSGVAPLSPDRERALKPGDDFKEFAEGPEMVVVPAGSFTMGSPEGETGRSDDEGPQHMVTIGKPFAVGKFAVTFDEWDACVADGGCNGYKPSDRGWGRGRRPVINVSWDDATAYAAWLSRKTGKTYRLLSEAEWEYVTRAGTTTPFWWGGSISPQQANYDGNYTYGNGPKGEYRQRTLPVDSFEPNSWGLYQVHGNVWEWTQDCWHDSYAGAPSDGSAWTTVDCSRRILRGGAWYNDPRDLRAAIRDGHSPDNRYSYIGFRLGRTLTP